MVQILSDSTCDLTPELVKKYDIKVLPLHVLLGERDCRDGVDVTADDVYRWADENNTTPKTAAPSPQEVMEVLELLLADGDEVICFALSEKMSSTLSVMKMAVEELEVSDRVWVFNSQNLSTGLGLLAIEAAIMAQLGKPASEIIGHLEKIRPQVRSSFVVDTLTYLHRGGRCNGVAALAGSMLKLHPRIVVADGAMNADKKYRGKLSKVVCDYVQDMEADLKAARKERVFITHSGCDQAIINEVFRYLEQMDIFEEILVTRAGCVVSSHCGPGTLGVLFIAR